MNSIPSSVTSSSSRSVFTWDIVHEALDNELILNMIFDNLVDYCDLQICRLVCTKWNRLIVKHIEKYNWMNRRIIRFKKDEKIQEFIHIFGSFKTDSMLFSCFSFHKRLNHILLKNFFKIFSQKIKLLYIYYRLQNLTQLEDILKSQSTSLMELAILSFIEDFRTFSIEKKNSNTDLENIFDLTNLTYLCIEEKISNYGHYMNFIEELKRCKVHIDLMNLVLSKIPMKNKNLNSGQLQIFLKKCNSLTASINSLEMSGHIKHLKMIDLESFKLGDLNILTNANVQLKFFTMGSSQIIGGNNGNNNRQMIINEVYQFLQSQMNSLEVLKLESRVFKFPSVMPILNELHLIYVTDVGDIDQFPIFYHQYFPNLQVLLIRSGKLQFQWSSEFILQFLSPQEPCLSLKKLSIHYYSLRGEVMKKISSIFPQIKSLTIGNSFQYLSHIEENLLYFEIWNSSFAQTLEELYLEIDEKEDENELIDAFRYTLPGCLKLDSLFSGVEQDQIGLLYNSHTTMAFKNQKLDESKYNSILKFKNLKTLKMTCHSPQGYPFTDFSAFYIFGNMKKLEVLHLDEKLRIFSPGALKYLRNKKRLTSSSQVQGLAISENNLEVLSPIDWEDSFNTAGNTFHNLLDKIKVKGNVVDVYNINDNDNDNENINEGCSISGELGDEDVVGSKIGVQEFVEYNNEELNEINEEENKDSCSNQ